MKVVNLLSTTSKLDHPPSGKFVEKILDSRSLRGIWIRWFLGIVLPLMLENAVRAETPQEWVKANLEWLVGLYRHLHAHPELSQHERETSLKLSHELQGTGAEVTGNVGGFGVVGLLRNGEGPTVMLRCDLDALPVTEQTELAYSSKVKVQADKGLEVGVMHACGHDVHMTNLVGVAKFLASHKNQWQGTAMFVCQPAEERGAGARAMLSDGLFTRFPKPDAAIALHVDAYSATGTVGIRGGYSLANVDSVDITVKGKGGHGAYPHRTIDPIVQAAELILSLQTLVSREVKPTEPAVVTVGSIHAGTQHNIIGSSCQLQLTVRSYSDEVRSKLLEGIRRKAKAIALAYDAPEPDVQVSEGTPSLRNDDKLATQIAATLKRILGEDKVVDAEPSMGGEDFSEYGRAGVPILMFRLGAVSAKRLERFQQLGQEPPSLHSPLFYPDVEEALSTGVPALAEAAMELLKAKPRRAEGDK
jgi:amidohydrolase